MDYNKIIYYSLTLCIGLILGFFIGTQYYPKTETKIIETTKPTIIQGETKTLTETEIKYIPKETVIVKYINSETGKEVLKEKLEDIDLDANINKPNFIVKLNNKEVEFTKSDDEKYLFEKNKLSLNQTSTIIIDTKVSPQVIDNTKYWAIGIGYGENGVAYKLDFPLGKRYWNGWIYKDDDNSTIGISKRF